MFRNTKFTHTYIVWGNKCNFRTEIENIYFNGQTQYNCLYTPTKKDSGNTAGPLLSFTHSQCIVDT